MSKRPSPKSASSSIQNPTKIGRVDSAWASIPFAEVKDNEPSGLDIIPDSVGTMSDFKPVDGGPKYRVLKSVVLNYKPRVVVDIALNGPTSQLRFTDDHHSFTMSGDEYVELTGTHLGPRSFASVRLEPLDDEEFRLARYHYTSSGMSELNPVSVFTLNKYAARRLKSKHNIICQYAIQLMANQEVILAMFMVVQDVYKSEYARLNSLRPITEHFIELSCIVEMFVPAVVIVKAFLERLQTDKHVSSFNHYSLLSAVLCKKDYISRLLG